MHRHLLLTGMAFTLALVTIGCWSSHLTIQREGADLNRNANSNNVRETVRKQLGTEKVRALRVQDDAGNIRVTAGDDNTKEIAIRAEKIVSGDRPVAELKTYLARVQANTHLE